MKLFDLTSQEKNTIQKLLVWHLIYLAAIALFFLVIYYFGLFKSRAYLREGFIFIYLAPLCTLLFVVVSPWRRDWVQAIKNTYYRLEGEPAFCLMGALVFYFGFFLYSVLLWGLGALGPSLFYM